MSVPVVMPKWGMGMEEGVIGRWLKEVGDSVELDEPLVEIEAAKATQELGSPARGVLRTILLKEGEEAKVGTTIAEIDETR